MGGGSRVWLGKSKSSSFSTLRYVWKLHVQLWRRSQASQWPAAHTLQINAAYVSVLKFRPGGCGCEREKEIKKNSLLPTSILNVRLKSGSSSQCSAQQRCVSARHIITDVSSSDYKHINKWSHNTDPSLLHHLHQSAHGINRKSRRQAEPRRSARTPALK